MEKGDFLTNKKLQKLLYYVEAWNLVYYESLIDEDFEAWVHGPVVPEIYRAYKNYGYSPINIKINHLKKSLSYLEEKIFRNKNRKQLFDTIIDKYGNLASFQLEYLTHSETPWLKAREGLGPTEPCGNIIDKVVMKKYYSSLINKK